MRHDGEQRDAAHDGCPQHTGRGLHDNDEGHQGESGQRDSQPRPEQRADINTAPHTMVTLAPDTAVKWVNPAARNPSVVCAVKGDVSPSTSAGSIAA
jgi:hypothetical protein